MKSILIDFMSYTLCVLTFSLIIMGLAYGILAVGETSGIW